MTTDAITLLAHCPLFRGLTPPSLKTLAALCTRREAAKDDVLFLEGARGAELFVLLTGSVQLVKTTEGGREIVIRTVQPGEMFAEIVLFEQDVYPVTANVLSPSRLLAIPSQGFRRLLDAPSFRDEFLGVLLRRMRYLAERILELTAYDVDQRFVRFLEQQYGRRPTYSLPLSKKALAAAIGATPETLSRMILRLESEKLIQWKGRRLEVSSQFWTLR